MIFPTLELEKELWNSGYSLICGLDEVGRGSFAGPVCVGAVIFPRNCKLIKGIADSKLLTHRVLRQFEVPHPKIYKKFVNP